MAEAFTIKGMHVGESSRGAAEDEELTFMRQLGIKYVDVSPPERMGERGLGVEQGYLLEQGHWDTDAIIQWRQHVESFGLKLIAMSLPRGGGERIMRGLPEGDRDIENICKNIEAAGKAGIPMMRWHLLEVLGVLRSMGWTYGRGGVKQKYFDYETVRNEPPYPHGPIDAEQSWERIEYFIKRVIPVAEEYKVKMAWHQSDPAVPETGHRGVARVLGTVEGMKRLVDLHPSPYHGICLCQGTLATACTSPEQVYDAIRYFGERKKIFFVHLRNLRGGFLKFEETFPEEGDVDMLKAMRIYKEVGYNGVFVPDHVPRLNIDTSRGHRARAYCYGYIRALIQAVESGT